MKRILCVVLCILLSFGLLRSASGSKPLGLSGFLDAVSTVDLSFTGTLESVTALKDSLKFPTIREDNVFKKVASFFKWIYRVCLMCIRIPIAIIVDVLDFLYSVFEFFYKLMEADYNPEDKYGSFGSGGFGGGAGGAR